jgi:acyl transferase domain-containing protein
LKDQSSSLIDDPEFSQPICTALQVALIELLYSWNIYPSAVVGHSSGEIAAAFASGAISRTTAWKLAYHRGHLSAAISRSIDQVRGGMLAVGLGSADAALQIEELGPKYRLTIACINSPKNVTVSGSEGAIDALKALLDTQKIFARKLQVQTAYHSDFMQPITAEYRTLIGTLQPGTWHGLRVPAFYSSLTGKQASSEDLLSPSYWVNNLASTVKFSDAVTQMLADSKPRAKQLRQQASFPISELVEIGPHAALRGPIREIMDQIADVDSVTYTSILRRGASAVDTALEVASWLYCRGHAVDILALSTKSADERSPQMLINLPGYAFDHSKQYWNESRLYKSYRFRKVGRHELLGAPVPDWDPSNAIWRNWIRISENPWILDHRVTGSVLYPAAGMLVMAIEASRQLANPDKHVKGFRLKDVSIQMALVIAQTQDGTETHFHVRPYNDSTSSTSSTVHEFELRSCVRGVWSTHCRGLIQTEYETSYTPVDDGLEENEFIRESAETVAAAEDACNIPVQPSQFYEILSTVGLDFGTTFQNISNIRTGQSQNAIATVSTPQISMAHDYIQPHLIHPTTLDGIFHTALAGLTKGGQAIKDVCVPTAINEVWVAADADQSSHRVQASGQLLGLRQMQADLVAVNPVSKTPTVTINGFVTTALSQSQSTDDQDNQPRHLCFNIDWKPEPALLSRETATKAFPLPTIVPHQDTVEKLEIVRKLCLVYIKRYLKTYSTKDGKSRKPHHIKYISWAQHKLLQFERGETAPIVDFDKLVEDDEYFKLYEEEMDNAFPEATVIIAAGRVLSQMLDGELDPLQVLFAEKRAENVYHHGIGMAVSYINLSNYIDTLAHKNPSMDILEIGAGTGSATRPILETLSRHGEGEIGALRFNSYDFTDISPSFFEKAKERFKHAAPRINFRTLNVEKDPAQQNFVSGHYDLIVAANVLQ